MSDIFKDFEIISKEELEEYKSELNYVCVPINSLYGWGVGYYNQGTYDFFNSYVKNALEEKGYTFEKGNTSASADTLHKDGSALSIYMHPMELTGAATEEEIKDIMEIVGKCGEERRYDLKVHLAEIYPLYDIPDNTYRRMIFSKAYDIALVTLANDSINASDIGFALGEEKRIDRLQQKYYGNGCYGSNDIDIECATVIAEKTREIKEKNPRMSNEHIAKAVACEVADYAKIYEDTQTVLTALYPQLPLEERVAFFGFSRNSHNEDAVNKLIAQNINEMPLKICSIYRTMLKGNELNVSFAAEGKVVIDTIRETDDALAESKAKKMALNVFSDFDKANVLEVNKSQGKGAVPYIYSVKVKAAKTVERIFASPADGVQEALRRTHRFGIEDLVVKNSKITSVGEFNKIQLPSPDKDRLSVVREEDGSFAVNGIKGITKEYLNMPDVVCAEKDGELYVKEDNTGHIIMPNPAYGRSYSELVYLAKEQSRDTKEIEREIEER